MLTAKDGLELCPECDGAGVVSCCDCPNCNGEENCDWCHTTGLSPEVYDTEAYKKACDELLRTHNFTWAYAVDGKVVGQEAPGWTRVLIADFRRSK